MFGLGAGALVWAAFGFSVIGFLARDELYWRILMFCASLFFVAYYFFVSDMPLWDAILTNGTLAFVNLCMIALVLFERSTLSMNAEMTSLHKRFHLLTPGQFRRLMSTAQETEVNDQPLIKAGERQKALYFLIDGQAEIEKNGKRSTLEAGNFLGEIAYITGAEATASIRLKTGARCLRWNKEDLTKLTFKKPAIGTGLAAHLNSDMAQKLAISSPSI